MTLLMQNTASLKNRDASSVFIRTMKTKNANRYRREIRSAARGLWSGVLDMDGFIRAMASAVQSGMRRATVEGISECGFSLNELEQSELRQIAGRVTQIQMRIARYGNWIAQNNRASGAKLAPVFARAELWTNQYFSIMLFSRSLACGDKKYMWVLGATEQHCRTCAALNGKVKRMSYWRENVLPRNAPNDNLECGGWRCDCDLIQTDAPLSRGRLPSLVSKALVEQVIKNDIERWANENDGGTLIAYRHFSEHMEE